MKLSPLQITSRVAVGVFLILTIATLLDPSYGFGLSVGFAIIPILASLALASAFSAMIWNLILDRGLRRWSKTRASVFAVMVLVTSVVFHLGVMLYANRSWGFIDYVVRNKIEYFCLEHFNQHECVRQVNLCPKCTLKIDRWKRLKMAERLKAYRAEYPSKTPPKKVSN